MPQVPDPKDYPKTFKLRDGTQAELRPREPRDNSPLLEFYRRIPEEDLYYLKDDVTDPEVVREWTSNVLFDQVVPIEALVGGEIIGDATLHRGRHFARRHIAELRIVVEPKYRRSGVGRRLAREILDISAALELYKVFFELVPIREEAAIRFAENLGFHKVATLPRRIRDYFGGYQDVVVLEVSLSNRDTWWRDGA